MGHGYPLIPALSRWERGRRCGIGGVIGKRRWGRGDPPIPALSQREMGRRCGMGRGDPLSRRERGRVRAKGGYF